MTTSQSLAQQIETPLKALILETGDYIREEFRRFSFSDVKYKSVSNPVTHVDVQADALLKAGCRALIPGSGFINEESGEEQGENGYTWIIDPIDGTTNFAHGIPHFSISVGLKYHDELLMGKIYDVMRGEMFAAIKGQGATLSGQPIRVSGIPRLEESVIATGFPYGDFPWLGDFLNLVMHLIKKGHGLRRMGSAALDLAYVASGRMEGFFEMGLSPWDIAAGVLIVKEAGGQVSDFEGGNAYFNGSLFASNGKIHNEVLAAMQEGGSAYRMNGKP